MKTFIKDPESEPDRQPHTSRNCLSSPLTVHSLTTAFISPEGESLHSNLTEKTPMRQCLLRVTSMRTSSSTPLKINMTKCLHTLLWSQCSFLRLQRRPPTCHRGIQCTVGKTWHSHSFPDHAGSILQKKVIRILLKSVFTCIIVSWFWSYSR